MRQKEMYVVYNDIMSAIAIWAMILFPIIILLTSMYTVFFIARWIDCPICVVTNKGNIIYINKPFQMQCNDLHIGINIFSKIKWYPSGYVEFSNKNGFIKVLQIWRLRLITITQTPPVPYICISLNGTVLKSRWPFISVNDNFFDICDINKHCMQKQNLILTQINGIRSVLYIIHLPEYITVLDLSAFIRPETIKMATLGKESVKIAHDLNNLFVGIIGCTDLLTDNKNHKEALNTIKYQTRQAINLLQQVLTWTLPKNDTLCYISPHESLIQMQLFLKCIIGGKAILSINGSTKSKTSISPSSFEQIITNIITNAREAITGASGKINIYIFEEEKAEFVWSHGLTHSGRYIIIRIQDSGPGISQQDANKIFQSNYSTKESGTGQGLNIVADLLAEAKGFIMNIPSNSGAIFEIGLPVVQLPKDNQQRNSFNRKKILIVEDEESIRSLVSKSLLKAGHQVLTAHDLNSAHEQLSKHLFDILVIDSGLPDGNGIQLLEYAAIHNCKIIMVSGYSKDLLRSKINKDIEFEFLSKPFTMRELLDQIARL